MKQSALNVLSIIKKNHALVLNCIRNSPISRADISKLTGLSKSSVTTITNEFINNGLIKEIGIADSSFIGRKPILLDISPSYRFAIGVYLHRKILSVVITDLKMNLINRKTAFPSDFKSADEILNWIFLSADQLINENNLDINKCIGVGCACPGPLDYKSGTILNPPDFPIFKNFPLGDILKEHFEMPVFIENNAVLLAKTEYRTQDMSNYNQILFLVIQDGIGSAILSDGKVVRGSSGFAGELGHTSVDLNGKPCSCGNRGCLEQYITLKALKETFGFCDYKTVVDNAYADDEKSLLILNYIAKYLSCALTNSIRILDLDCIVIFGELNYRSEKLLELLRTQIKNQTSSFDNNSINISIAKMAPETADITSTAKILDEFYNQNLDK